MNTYKMNVESFDNLAEDYHNMYMHNDLYTDSYQMFCELLIQPNASIFEVACGPGNMTRYLLNQRPDYQIEGIDMAPKMIELAKINVPEASFQLMDIRDISTINKEFDAIVCAFCLPYLEQQIVSAFIQDARNLLKTDGLLYLSTMEDDYEKSGYTTSSQGESFYIHYYPYQFLQEQLETNGFNILKHTRQPFTKKNGDTLTDLFIYAKKSNFKLLN